MQKLRRAVQRETTRSFAVFRNKLYYNKMSADFNQDFEKWRVGSVAGVRWPVFRLILSWWRVTVPAAVWHFGAKTLPMGQQFL